MKARSDKKAHNKKNISSIDYESKGLSVLYFLPLLLIASFVPLIVHARYIDLSGTTQALYWTGQRQYPDFFSYWKSRWIVVLTAIALIFYIGLYKQKKLPLKGLKQYYIPLSIYGMFVIISSVFALDIQTALWGFVDMYQGMFVLMSYVLITFLTINFVNNERDVNLFVNAFLLLMIVEGIIGVGQYFGFDFFQSKLGKILIVPANLKLGDLSFSFGSKTIYGTLFNTNFVGSFAALMLPLSIGAFMSAKTRNRKIVSGIAVLLMVFTWLGCNSRAGYMGVAVSAIIALIIFRKLIIKHRKISVLTLFILIAAFLGLNIISEGEILSRVKTLNIKQQIEDTRMSDEGRVKFEDIILGENSFSIKTNKETLNFNVDGDKLYLYDGNNEELGITSNGNEITINDSDYSGYKIIIPDNYLGIKVIAYGKTINFYLSDDGVKIIGSGGRLTEPKASPFFEPLRGLETIASNRGYEWGASIPMLKDYLIVGSGPDNFPIAFNQDDFVAKLNLISFDANIVIDKPHNMYLQIGLNTGVISLIAFLTVCIMYIIETFKVVRKFQFKTTQEIICAVCLVSIIGYLVAGFFNDAVVSVSPLFWIILGLGIGINHGDGLFRGEL